jgi:hypothetical protein
MNIICIIKIPQTLLEETRDFCPSRCGQLRKNAADKLKRWNNLPDVFVATHVDLLKLLRVIGAEILPHFDSDMLWQHRQQKSFL